MIFRHPLSLDTQTEEQRNVFFSGYNAGIPVRFLDTKKTFTSYIEANDPRKAHMQAAKNAFLSKERRDYGLPFGTGFRFQDMSEEVFALFARNLLQFEHQPLKYIEIGELLVPRNKGIYTEDGIGAFSLFIRGFYKPDNPHAYRDEKREHLSEGIRFFINRGHPLFISYDGPFEDACNWYDRNLITELSTLCPPVQTLH